MPKVTNKQMSVEHEDFIAKQFYGRREPASGASITAPGDVFIYGDRTYDTPYSQSVLVECKVSESGTVSISRKGIEKIREEAATRGCRPMIALRLRDPYTAKHIDVVVKLVDDELEDLNELGRLRWAAGEI